MASAIQDSRQNRLPPEPPSLAGCSFDFPLLRISVGSHRNFVQTDILDRGPDNREATGLRREHVNLISTLAHVTKQTLNGIGGLNVAMQRLRKRIKRQQVFFVLSQASYRFWITFAVFGFESSQLGQCLLFCRLLPDAHQFGLDIATLSSGDRLEDIALLVH